MSSSQEDSRGQLEDTMGQLGVAMILLDDQVQLRIAQAIRRDHSLDDLLTPALTELIEINEAMQAAHGILGQIWIEKSKQGWSQGACQK
jgi:hypothetical protein